MVTVTRSTILKFPRSSSFIHMFSSSKDDYDKEIKETKQKPRHTPGPSRPKKPDQPVYRPRRGGLKQVLSEMEQGKSGSSSTTEPDLLGSELFCLEFEADGGEITAVTVCKQDDPEAVADKICSRNKLDPLMRQALKRRIQEEMAKRQLQR
ncbi:UPF0561 protein C2orf68 homolog isoform X2 [Ambystoma mexicanum]|uniref:UPF0561 protein C2orf68 homolog isoform X2 n=1 Tax=Ambystoma mexicanum TaxID=8296 RepID=UPI0037E85EB2